MYYIFSLCMAFYITSASPDEMHTLCDALRLSTLREPQTFRKHGYTAIHFQVEGGKTNFE